MPKHHHLSDEDLLTLVERAADVSVLGDCEPCGTRHAQLLCVLADLDGWHPEADAVFDEPRLAHQRAHILRRLERNHGPARVLPFPAAGAPDPARPRHLPGLGRRWMAAAAIGGLMVGLFTGRFLDVRDVLTRVPQARIAEPRLSPARSEVIPADLGSVDELLLGEVEAALARPRPVELRAIDALTPVAR
jgi:hypothetical protein